ncbi:unnamed protein product [Boreogadus saida]
MSSPGPSPSGRLCTRQYGLSVGSWGPSKTAVGGGSMPSILVPAAGMAVDGPDVGGRRRMGSTYSAPTPPFRRKQVGALMELVPDHTPRARADCGRGPSGLLVGARNQNILDCVMGVGVVGTSEP